MKELFEPREGRVRGRVDRVLRERRLRRVPEHDPALGVDLRERLAIEPGRDDPRRALTDLAQEALLLLPVGAAQPLDLRLQLVRERLRALDAEGQELVHRCGLGLRVRAPVAHHAERGRDPQRLRPRGLGILRGPWILHGPGTLHGLPRAPGLVLGSALAQASGGARDRGRERGGRLGHAERDHERQSERGEADVHRRCSESYAECYSLGNGWPEAHDPLPQGL
ncbi:MAG: hypothetical protein R3F49_01785 [Planctomycetota bacterium]